MFSKEFYPNLAKFFEYIDYGLTQKTSAGIVRNACGCIGDLCIFNCGDIFVEQIDKIVPKIFDILSDANVDWSVKVRSISILGDLIMWAWKEFEPYMSKAMQILEFAASWVIDYEKKSTDEDFTEYILNLITSLIETYTSII